MWLYELYFAELLFKLFHTNLKILKLSAYDHLLDRFCRPLACLSMDRQAMDRWIDVYMSVHLH